MSSVDLLRFLSKPAKLAPALELSKESLDLY